MTDSPHLPSGQGRVGREIATGLVKHGHEVGYIGWFHNSELPRYDIEGIKCWFTNNSHYGADVLDQVVNKFQPDVLLTVGDFWNLSYITDPHSCRTRRFFQWCSYIPVDGEPINGGLPPGIVEVVKDIDIPIAYTDYAKGAVLKSVFDQETRNRIQTIYHGVDTNMFKPLEFSERKRIREEMGIGDRFVFLTVSRNQSRKNIPELLRAWKIFSELPQFKDKVTLWPHMNFNDSMGWRIDDLLDVLKLRNNSIMYYDQVAHAPSEMHLIRDEELAKIYQIADAFILIAGEGFGLPTFEAMATRLPCVLLDYAASSELGADGRAELVSVGNSFTWTGGHLTQRPIPDIQNIVNSMSKVYLDRAYRNSIANKGFEFATKFTWDKVLDDWNGMFLQHEIPFLKPMKMEVVT